MGRYNLAPARVHAHATNLLRTPQNQHTFPPPWYTAIFNTPPSSRLTRPPLRRRQEPGRKPSKLFHPVRLRYKEDELRWEYFNDHPWELARPRIVLEEDGRDRERWDWSVELDFALNRPRIGRGRRDEFGRTVEEWDRINARLSGRPLDGEAVIQRQHHLETHSDLTPAAAYDKARKELYRLRHFRETEVRVAREEAQATGAFFGPGPLEIGMRLEDAAYKDWREWAMKEIVALKQAQSAAYTGAVNDGADGGVGVGGLEDGEEAFPEEMQVREVAEAIPGSRRGQEAKGGQAVHP